MSCKKENAVVNNEKTAKKDIVVLASNDVMSQYTENIGYDGLKYYIDNFDTKNNYLTLIDCGNFSKGSDTAEKSSGKSSLDIMQKVNYDIIVPGADEFAYGYQNFLDNVNGIKDKIISCNVYDINKRELVFSPYKIIEYDSMKIAYIGVTSPETLYLCDEQTFFDDGKQYVYFFEDSDGQTLYAQIQKTVNEVKSQGVDKVILVGNMGITDVLSKWTSTSIISNTIDIDAVIDGHSKELIENGLMINKHGSFVPLVQSGEGLKYLSVMNVTADGYLFPAILSVNSFKNKDKHMTDFINEIRENYKN